MKRLTSLFLRIYQATRRLCSQIKERGLGHATTDVAFQAVLAQTDKGMRVDLSASDQHLIQRVEIAQLRLEAGRIVTVPTLQQVFANHRVRRGL